MTPPAESFTIASIELSKPLAPLMTGGRPVLALARWQGRPIGWVSLNPAEKAIPPAELETAVFQQLAWPLILNTLADATPAPASSPPISIVICTRNRPTLLERCLASVVSLQYPAFEVIVVDNAPDDEATRAAAARFRARYVREDRPGLDWARNRGIAEARNDIIAFTDDDATVDPAWLEGIARGFESPAVMAVTGLVAPMELDTPAQTLFERVYGGMGKGFTGRLFHRSQMRPSQMIAIHAVGVGANMAFRRAAFDQVGEFDTALDVGTPSGGGGDLDMFHRIITAGMPLWYEPRALVWHQHRREMPLLERQLYDDGRSFGVYLRKLWKTRSVPRYSLLRFTVFHWGRWLVGRVVAGMLGRHRMPSPLLRAGLRGALASPGAYRATYRSDRLLRHRAPGAPPAAQDALEVSVIVPAFNARSTLAECLESVRNQTCARWEVVVVDDGSTDGTVALAKEYAARDPRIKVVEQQHAGLSAARNLGLAKARYSWVLFLDADDWVLPTQLERMTAVLADDPSLDAVHCGWRIATETGETLEEDRCRATGDLFHLLARHPAFVVHACLIRRRLVQSVGGFDPAFPTIEDWVMWQRVARGGCRFGHVPEPLAGYRMKSGSMSSEVGITMEQGLRAIALGHGTDPSVPCAAPEHAAGRPADEEAEAQLAFLGWPAGIMLARGEDARALLARVKPSPWPGLASYLGEIIYSAAPRALGRARSVWSRIWPEVSANVEAFLLAVEAHASAPGLSRAVRHDLARRILQDSTEPFPVTIGATRGIRLELTDPVTEVPVSSEIERLWCSVEVEGERIGVVELPVCAAVVPSAVLKDAVADQFAWLILGRFFQRTVYRAENIVGEHDTVGWDILLREAWSDATEAAVPMVQENGWIAIEISRPLPDPGSLNPEGTFNVLAGGVSAGAFNLPPKDVKSVQAIRSAINELLGYELCRVVVREALIGSPWDDRRLRDRLRAKADQQSPTGSALPMEWRRLIETSGPVAILERRGELPIGGSGSRRAVLPGEAAADLGLAGRPALVAYVPEIVSRPITPIHRDPGSAAAPAAQATPDVTDRLPILRYTQVAENGTAARARWRVTPRQFELQLRYLRDAGFHSVSLAAWRAAMAHRRPLPGRAVLITFDDGYIDFASEAWPLLRQYGFSALVFVVSERVGGKNDWDPSAAAGDALMDWNALRRLQSEGLEVGSHSATHPRLSSLPVADVVREAATSKTAIERELDRPVSAFAYPFGDHDAAIQHLVGACGYDQGFTCFPSGRASLNGRLLNQPRIEVFGSDDLAAFIAKLE